MVAKRSTCFSLSLRLAIVNMRGSQTFDTLQLVVETAIPRICFSSLDVVFGSCCFVCTLGGVRICRGIPPWAPHHRLRKQEWQPRERNDGAPTEGTPLQIWTRLLLFVTQRHQWINFRCAACGQVTSYQGNHDKYQGHYHQRKGIVSRKSWNSSD